MRKLALVSFLALCQLAVAEEVLTTRDGKTYSGTFVSGDSRGVVFRDSTGARRQFNMSEIQSIEFNGPGTSGAFGRDVNRNAGTYSNRADRSYSNRAAGAARDVSIPQGAEIGVRTNEAIDSNSATEGQTFSANISKDVTDSSGAVVVPRGSPAQLVIRRTAEGGATGSANMALDLQSVTVDGRTYLVSTEDVARSDDRGIGANRRTATMVGGGAALGTLLGAIAGGGKGAAIGAVAGAVAGGAAQVLTRGKEVKVPAETELTFRLDQPLRLQAVQ